MFRVAGGRSRAEAVRSLAAGRAHPASGDDAKAAAHFEASIEVHERCGAPLLLAEPLLDWADAIDRTQIAGPVLMNSGAGQHIRSPGAGPCFSSTE
jgi:hypothetical protein